MLVVALVVEFVMALVVLEAAGVGGAGDERARDEGG